MSGPDRPPPPGLEAPRTAAWKAPLALVCLALSGLLWVQGLVDSLQRPSVIDSLTLRQLELTALAADSLPPGLRPLLTGQDPREELAEKLEDRLEAADTPPSALERLELALLRRTGPDGQDGLPALLEMVDAPRRPLLRTLLEGRRADPERQRQLLAPWQAPTMVRQLSCEQLGGPGPTCPAATNAEALVLRLLAVNVLPALLALLGTGLLLRETWRLWRQRIPPAPPLEGPPLGLVDVTLLIAGGFVLLGEVLVPTLAQPLLDAALRRAALTTDLAQALQVLLLYLTLTLAPLLILRQMLRGRQPTPAGGWLQWLWRPPLPALGRAVRTLLMVLPLVALSGWLIERLWSDPGGSNPLLELVLTGDDPRALACFAVTALVIAPLFEETIFRGVLLPAVGRHSGGAAAVVISAAVFAVAHLSLSELMPLFVLGLGLGWLRWRSGRLSCCAWMHSLWNGMTFANLLLLAG